MTYNLRKALYNGTALNNAFGVPRETPKYVVTLTNRQMAECLGEDGDPETTWEAIKILLQVMGVHVDQLKHGILSETENEDGSVTLELS